MVSSDKPQEGRLLRGCGWAALAAAILVVGMLVALQVAARRAESRSQALSVAASPRRTAAPGHREPRSPLRPESLAEWPALARLAPRLERESPLVPPAPTKLAAEPGLDVTPLFALALELRQNASNVLFALEWARRDADVLLGEGLLARLVGRADLLADASRRLTADGESALTGFDAQAGAWPLRSLLLLDAVRLADAGDVHAARERLAAVLVICGSAADRGSNTTPWIPLGVLRRVRPPEPATFLDVLDAQSGTPRILASLDSMIARRDHREPPSFEEPTLAALHEGLPPLLREAVTGLVLMPRHRIERERHVKEIIAVRDYLDALGPCPVPAEWLQDPAHGRWLSEVGWSVGSDNLFTREVLRAALPPGAVEMRSSGCDSWSVTAVELGNGMRRVTLVGLAAGSDGLPPSYDVPAPS